MFAKTLQIFIAGAKDLHEERAAVVAAVHAINARVEPQGHIRCRSFENISQNQTDYDAYITSCNLLLFVVDGRIGKKTLDEFKLANKNNHAHNKPKLLIFFKGEHDMSPDARFACGVLNVADDYWVSYNSLSELRTLVEQKLDTAVRDVMKAPRINLRAWFRSYWKGLLSVLLSVLILCCCLMAIGRVHDNTNPTAFSLVLGGGSAANYVQRFKGIDLTDFAGGYYVHIPSGNAPLFLTEEVITPQEKDGRKKYYPICLSAEEYVDSCFLIGVTKERFLRKGAVISFCIGYDTLSVYAPKDLLQLEDPRNERITTKELARIIKNEHISSLNVFTTSPKSGTRHRYEEELKLCGFDFSMFDTYKFSEDSEWAIIHKNDLPYVILGSGCYYMNVMDEEIKKGNILRLNVVDDEFQFVRKPVMVYCMAYSAGTSSSLRFPPSTIAFLQQLGVQWEGKLHNDMIQRSNLDHIILNFSELPKW